MTYTVAQFLNPLTGKLRWGVKRVSDGTLFFPAGRGKAYAVRLRARLKKGNT